MAWVECALLAGGAFEVRSGSGEAVAAVHCSGQRAAAAAAAWRPLGAAEARQRCDGESDPSALYSAFAAVGLQYGPAFRTVEAAWAGGSEATARLRRRTVLAGTHVHPADLDGALQVSLLPWMRTKSRSGGSDDTRLPFAVDGVLMRGPTAGQLWVVASESGPEAAAVALGGGDELGYAQLDGFRSRVLRTEAKYHQEHMYETAWRDVDVAALSSGQLSGGAIVVGSLNGHALHGFKAVSAGSCASIVVADTQATVLPLLALAAMLQIVRLCLDCAPPSIWIASTSTRVAGAGVMGLARVARAEAPALPLGSVALRGSLGGLVGPIARMTPQAEPELAEGTVLHQLGYTTQMVSKL